MTSKTPILAVSQNFPFLHLVQTLLDDIGLPVRATSDWRRAPSLAAEVRADVAIVDLVPGNESTCWLTAEALKSQAATRNIHILMCPVAPWLLDDHGQQLSRLEASIWSGNFDLQVLIHQVTDAVASAATFSTEPYMAPSV
jgi:hypothetical protein